MALRHSVAAGFDHAAVLARRDAVPPPEHPDETRFVEEAAAAGDLADRQRRIREQVARPVVRQRQQMLLQRLAGQPARDRRMSSWGGHRESNPDVADHNRADEPLSYDRHVFLLQIFQKRAASVHGASGFPNGSPSADRSQMT